MKKKLGDLNRKIRHSKKKRDGLIHKRNSLRKVIENIKVGVNPPKVKELSGNVGKELSMVITEVLGLTEDLRWMQKLSSLR